MQIMIRISCCNNYIIAIIQIKLSLPKYMILIIRTEISKKGAIHPSSSPLKSVIPPKKIIYLNSYIYILFLKKNCIFYFWYLRLEKLYLPSNGREGRLSSTITAECWCLNLTVTHTNCRKEKELPGDQRPEDNNDDDKGRRWQLTTIIEF